MKEFIPTSISRRSILQAGAVGVLTALAGGLPRTVMAAPALPKKPNVLLVICDQLGWDAMKWSGCRDVSTPNLDRLAANSVTFDRAHSPNPVCSPARSALFTGRMPVEAGVIANAREIREGLPTMGPWIADAGYDTAYCGKWHLKEGWAYEGGVPGFTVLPTGNGQGALVDHTITLSCEAYLQNRKASAADKPFLLVASYMQPHDICFWAINGEYMVPSAVPFDGLQLPELPPNLTARPEAPADLDKLRFKRFKNDEQWRFYLYNYYRMVEMLDAEVGRLLQSLEKSGEADNTVIIFTSDHGDGRGRHGHVQKGYPYDEASRVPLMVSWPGHIAPRPTDDRHLASLLDILPTICDYAGAKPPDNLRGKSLRPLLETNSASATAVPWRDHLIGEFRQAGRFVRTDRYKYVQFKGDPVEQLFDLREDPWETRNLYKETPLADVLARHRNLLAVHEAAMDYAPNIDRATSRDKDEPDGKPRKRRRDAAPAALD